MHKVRFVSPKPMDPKKQNSSDPRDFVPVELEGWRVDDTLLYDLAVVKDARGHWDIYDTKSGRFLNSVKYETRKAAVEDLDKWACKLADFAKSNADWYRTLCSISDTLAHELDVIRFSEWKGNR